MVHEGATRDPNSGRSSDRSMYPGWYTPSFCKHVIRSFETILGWIPPYRSAKTVYIICEVPNVVSNIMPADIFFEDLLFVQIENLDTGEFI